MTNGFRIAAHSKGSNMAKVHQTDFGSTPGEEDFFEEIHSPTDNSEDSVEVKVCQISLKNKRKCTEPRRVQEKFTGPLKKRMCLKVISEKNAAAEHPPFRPWSAKDSFAEKSETDVKPLFKTNFAMPQQLPILPQYSFQNHAEEISTVPSSYFRPPSPINCYQNLPDEPVALIKKASINEVKEVTSTIKREIIDTHPSTSFQCVEEPRVPIHPHVSTMSVTETERLILSSSDAFPALKKIDSDACSSRREQRNYKNMTRERRIEANARERTRVHTISAAFETLRKSIPSYSHNQKLSKLSVLRIACSYIMTLSNIVQDVDPEKTAECVELITKTIQREGKLRKKKDDND